MAEIKSIKLLDISGRNDSRENLIVLTTQLKINFHAIDLQLNMEYRLHLFLFHLNKDQKIDSYAFYHNWNHSDIVTNPKEGKNDLLGHYVFPVKATSPSFFMEEWLMVRLVGEAPVFKGAKVFASMVPAISKASKWSNDYHMDVLFI